MSETHRHGDAREGHPSMPTVSVLIAVGAFAGATLRHAFGLVLAGLGGTFVANVLGCALLVRNPARTHRSG